MRFKAVTLGFVLAGTALASAALNLGRARGAAWIGQPLELVVPVQLDVGQTDTALCAEADVFHGDTRLDSSRIQVQAMPTDVPGTFNVKINSSTLIDEPVVTVYVRAGCAPKVSRKYVLLADFPSETVPLASNRAAAPLAPQVPTVTPAETALAGAAPGPAAASAVKPDTRHDKPAKPTPAPKEAPKEPAKALAPEPPPKKQSTAKAEKPAVPHPDSGTGKPRLRLDPVETLAERVKSLESTTTATTLQDDVARDTQKVQQLQVDLRTLLDQAVKNEASLAALRERLEKAEEDRVPVVLVYGLIALLALCLGALTYLWSKRSRQFAWADPAPQPGPARDAVPGAMAHTTAMNPSTRPDAFAAEDANIDLDLTDIGMDSSHTVLDSPVAFRESMAPQTGAGYDFNAESLLSRRQQARALATQGKIDEAIGLLEDGIRANPKESPLLFLDLLDIANTFSRKTDFRQFRQEFNRMFNASVPEFAMFRDEGRALDAYPALLGRINNQWESPHVMHVIEMSVLRTSETPETEPLDIAAFRELLGMHDAARAHHGAHAIS